MLSIGIGKLCNKSILPVRYIRKYITRFVIKLLSDIFMQEEKEGHIGRSKMSSQYGRFKIKQFQF